MTWRLRRLVQLHRWNQGDGISYRACFRPTCGFKMNRDETRPWSAELLRRVWKHTLKSHDALFHS